MSSAQNDNGEDTNYFDLSFADLQKLDSGKLAELIGSTEDLIKKLNANEKKKITRISGKSLVKLWLAEECLVRMQNSCGDHGFASKWAPRGAVLAITHPALHPLLSGSLVRSEADISRPAWPWQPLPSGRRPDRGSAPGPPGSGVR